MNTLDLHGVRHEGAKKLTIAFVEGHLGTAENVEIVTGHSPKMRKIATDVLDEYGLTYWVGGFLELNPAVILVEID